jgi:hypothetical protein
MTDKEIYDELNGLIDLFSTTDNVYAVNKLTKIKDALTERSLTMYLCEQKEREINKEQQMH